MEKHFGLNRTGTGTSPMEAKKMEEGARDLTTPPQGSPEIAEIRKEYLDESDPLGSIPLTTTLKGAVTVGLEAVSGGSPGMLIDKLGERLAFERSGVRLYDAIISKREADESTDFPLDTLKRFRGEELNHFLLLERVIREMGGDPTVMTPSADLSAVAAMGIQKVLVDPRVPFEDSLEALLIAELADNDAWNLLILLAEENGMDEAAKEFRDALAEEEEHLELVRSWLEKRCLGENAERQSA